jgi:beta-mannosidase
MHAKRGEIGGAERLFVRKAQYHWGWDWGPAINTSGPWRPVYLETFSSRISEFLVRQNVSPDLSSVTISITGSLDAPSKAAIVIVVEDPDGKKVLVKNAEQVEIEVDKQGQFNGEITLDRDLKLWYPFTYGSSPLYTVTAYLAGQDSVSRKLGLRRLRLLQHELKNAPGTSFTFEVNNVAIFAGGSCWIPGDFMLPRFTREKYEEWLLLAKSGNQCMVFHPSSLLPLSHAHPRSSKKPFADRKSRSVSGVGVS